MVSAVLLHTVREWFYNGHKLPRTFDCFLSLYDINAYKKSLKKLIWTKKKNQLPDRGIEPATLQIFQKDQLGIGPMWFIVVQIGQKWILEPLFSEI